MRMSKGGEREGREMTILHTVRSDEVQVTSFFYVQQRKSKQGYKEQCHSHQFLNGQVSEDDRAHQWILLMENFQMSPVNAKKA